LHDPASFPENQLGPLQYSPAIIYPYPSDPYTMLFFIEIVLFHFFVCISNPAVISNYYAQYPVAISFLSFTPIIKLLSIKR